MNVYKANTIAISLQLYVTMHKMEMAQQEV